MFRKDPDFPLTIFTLASARSGTCYLSSLFQNNVHNCVCRHEPFFDWGNPAMFGPAIYDASVGRLDRIRHLLARKRNYIARLRAKAYLESSHAFLKSVYLAALEYFPELRLVHLVRDPLMAAKSEAQRIHQRRHAPFHHYCGDDGRRHFYWSLTGNEEIYQNYDLARLSLFQKSLIEWIEIENRAMRFLDRHRLHDRCFTLDSPHDLNARPRIRALFDFLGLETRHLGIVLGGCRNESRQPPVIQNEDQRELEDVLERMPDYYLEIFRREPYTRFRWCGRFRSAAAGSRANACAYPSRVMVCSDSYEEPMYESS